MSDPLADVRPVRRVYLGLDADPYDALSTVVWTEITKVFTSTIRWGAQHELARVEPGYCALLLDNSKGDFEALNPASPYYPKLRPLNRLRIIDTWAGVDDIRFTGYVTDWPRSWTGIGQSVVQLEAYDALGAVLNDVDIPAWPWEMETRKFIESVPSTGKAVWLRLNETTGVVAIDSSGFGIDGQYQGTPTLDQAGFTPDGDKAVRFVTGSRVSLPDKNLISDYPFTLSCWFKSGTATTSTKMIFSAYDGAQAPVKQLVQVFISSSGASAGKIVVLVANPYPAAGTQVESTILVNDLIAHHLVVVCASSTSFKIYIDGTDRTAFWATTAHTFPNDLNTGYAVGNNPAVSFGEWRFGVTADDILDEVLVLDGLALTADQVNDLRMSGTVWPSLLNKSGQVLGRLLESLGWPSADADVDDGKTLVQQGYVAGKALAFANRLDVTEGGRLFVNGAGQIVFQDRHTVLQAPYTVSQATFGDGVGEINYVGPFNHGEDDADIHNDIHRGNVGGRVQVRRSKASKDRYGWKTHAVTDMWGTSDQEMLDRSNRDLAIYAEPVTRIRSLTVKPQEDAAQGTAVWPALLGLGQNSRVTVKAQPPGAALITQASHVERMEETVTGSDWQMTLGLSAAQASEFWVLGTSALDTGTVLAY